MKKLFLAVLVTSFLALPAMRLQAVESQTLTGHDVPTQVHIKNEGSTTSEAVNYFDTVSGVIANSYGEVTHTLFNEGLYCGSMDDIRAFANHAGTGAGGAEDVLSEDTTSGDQQAQLWRWQMRAAAGAHDAIVKVTAKADAKFTISHAALTALWATDSAIRVYAENETGIRKLIKETQISATTNTADCLGTNFSLKSGQILYVDYHYTGASGYGVIDFSPVIAADTTAYTLADVPSFTITETAQYWDAMSGVIANTYNDVSHTLFKEGFYYGKTDALTKFTANNGGGTGSANDQLLESTEGGEDQVIFWRWQMRCTQAHDAIIMVTALKDAKFTISHAALPADSWATFTSIRYIVADAEGTTIQLKDKAIAANTADNDYGISLSLEAGNILYIDYYSTQGTGTCSFAPTVTAEDGTFDAAQVPDFAAAKVLAANRKSALAGLKAAYDAYDSTKYDSASWAALTEAYNNGIAAINAATSETAITTAKTDAVNAMAAIPAIQTSASMIYWDSVTAVLNNNYNPLDNSLITYGFYYGKINDLKLFNAHRGTGDAGANDSLWEDLAKGDGQAAFQRWQMHCTGENDAIIKITAKKDMEVAVTHAATTATWASNTTVRYYAMDTDNTTVLLSRIPVSSDTSVNHFACTAYLKAGQTLFIDYYCSGAASDYGVVDFAPQVDVDTTKFDSTKVSDFQAEREIDEARTADVKTVNDAFANYAEADYTEENWAQIVSIKDDAISQLNNCYVVNDMHAIRDKALTDMGDIQTIAEANSELENYRSQKIQEADAAFNELDSARYSAADWKAIQDAYAQVKTDLAAATSKSKMNVLVLTFKSKIASYPVVNPPVSSVTSENSENSVNSGISSENSEQNSSVSSENGQPSNQGESNTGLVVGLAVGIPVVAGGVGVGLFFLLKKKKPL